MPDLVEKFFHEDLTPAEEEALSRQLLKSDRAALKFEAKAKTLYLSFGLAEPIMSWPKHGSLPWHGGASHAAGKGGILLHLGHLGHWIWPSLLAVGLTGSVLTWRHDHPKPLRALSSAVSPLPATPVAEVRFKAPKGVTPIPLQTVPPQSFSSLSITVSQAKQGLVVVRVLDLSGAQILSLYRGDLGAGNWLFQWDGKLTNGLPASAGLYRIEVQAGAFVQRKDVQIQ